MFGLQPSDSGSKSEWMNASGSEKPHATIYLGHQLHWIWNQKRDILLGRSAKVKNPSPKGGSTFQLQTQRILRKTRAAHPLLLTAPTLLPPMLPPPFTDTSTQIHWLSNPPGLHHHAWAAETMVLCAAQVLASWLLQHIDGHHWTTQRVTYKTV